ncbi:MAG: hypothetical protein AAGB46_08080 [Verrucomicrobiota bacterium]
MNQKDQNRIHARALASVDEDLANGFLQLTMRKKREQLRARENRLNRELQRLKAEE